MDVQNTETKESKSAEACENPPPRKLSQSTLVPPLFPPPSVSQPGTPPLPPASPHRPSSISTLKHTFSQHSIPGRPSSHNSNPDSLLFESSDLADEEVSHINSSAREWAHRQDSRGLSDSPFLSSPLSPFPLKNGSTTSLTGGNVKEKELKKFYSVDTRGFLAKPSWADDQRRHSIEICPSITDIEHSFADSNEDRKRLPLHVEAEYIHGVRRKKKMSPPCISIDPPMEEESNASARTKASENSLLRRRTPSCESTAYRDSLELAENQAGDQGTKVDRRAPPVCRGEHLTIPNFSYEQADISSAGGLSDRLSDSSPVAVPSVDSPSENAMAPELKKTDHLKTQCADSERNRELLGGTKSPLRKHGSVPATDEPIDEPV